MEKICKSCGVIFCKKQNYSKKYWETAKYCSRKCSRLDLPTPRKTNPNLFSTNGSVVEMVITKGGSRYQVLVDERDYVSSEISHCAWHLSSSGYPCRRVLVNGKYKIKPLHSFILPHKKGFVVDHINRNPLDNRKSNLRYLTHQNNLRNSSIRNKTGITGGRFCENGKISVSIKADVGKEVYLGRFKTIEEAKKARTEAEVMYWGRSFH